MLACGEPRQYEEVVPQIDGLHTYISVKFPIHNDSGEILGVCGISTEITDRKQTEMQIKRAREEAEAANDAKSRFLATISHEMRTPLHAILGMSDLLLHDIDEQEPHRKLRILNRSAQSLVHLINDVLDFEKMQANRLEIQARNHELGPLLTSYELTFPVIAASSHVSFRTKIDEAIPPFLEVDAVRLGQVLSNLVSNAAKHTVSGVVELRADAAGFADGIVQVEFSVSDTGCGIAKEHLPLLGQPFMQLSPPTGNQRSSGLGLAIVKGILELYGSELRVESVPGQGSRFSFVLGLPVGAPAPEPPPRPAEESASPLHVLIADDSSINIAVLSAYLDKWGFTYDMCENGREAVEVYSPEKHQAVILDVLMPEKNGIEAAHEILACCPDAKIIALTADLSPDNMAIMRNTPFYGVMGKPMDPELLRAWLLGAG